MDLGNCGFLSCSLFYPIFFLFIHSTGVFGWWSPRVSLAGFSLSVFFRGKYWLLISCDLVFYFPLSDTWNWRG